MEPEIKPEPSEGERRAILEALVGDSKEPALTAWVAAALQGSDPLGPDPFPPEPRRRPGVVES